MVSRRKYFSIFIMMAVLLFMFQFSQIIKESGNNYDVNEYAVEDLLSGVAKWNSYSIQGNSISTDSFQWEKEQTGNVLFWGTTGTVLEDVVKQWCTYGKRRLQTWEQFVLEEDLTEQAPQILLVDAQNVDLVKSLDALISYAKEGSGIVFCNLPDVQLIRENPKLAEMLGISEVYRDNTVIQGIHMFSGFLLGGEAIYKVQEPKENKYQDFDMTVPWYFTGAGTKTYMVGIMNEELVDTQDFPKLIWRNRYEDTMVFAVNGDFLSDLTALGILNSFAYEMQDYVIYPVVNAQSTVLADYPGMALEKVEQVEAVYSRDPLAVSRDIILPGIISMSTKNDLKLTCYLSTKYHYDDTALPQGEQLPFYLQQMKEMGAEAGKSLNYVGDITLAEKMLRDKAFYKSQGLDYQFATAYIKDANRLLEELFNDERAEKIKSVTCLERGEYPLLSYYTDTVTMQGVTNVAQEYSYKKDLQSRSLATALGYSNTLIAMDKVLWPETKEDQWENYFDKVFSNMSTYWTRFQFFEQTTASVSDARIRTLLNLDYATKREKDTLYLRTIGCEKDTWFILHTHGEAVADVVNGSFEKLEEDTYLIHGDAEIVQIKLERADEVFKYTEPFMK